MTNVNATVEELYPVAGKTREGRFLGFLPATTKTAQNDTVTVTNASKVEVATLVDSDDTLATMTYATNVITLTSATTGTTVSGLVVCQRL